MWTDFPLKFPAKQVEKDATQNYIKKRDSVYNGERLSVDIFLDMGRKRFNEKLLGKRNQKLLGKCVTRCQAESYAVEIFQEKHSKKRRGKLWALWRIG